MTAWEEGTQELAAAAARWTRRLRDSPDPPWDDVRGRLAACGIEPYDAVLAIWASAGKHAMSGIVTSRDERVFALSATFDLDSSGRPLPKDTGWIRRWREIDRGELRYEDGGVPNGWLHAVIVGREVFAREATDSE